MPAPLVESQPVSGTWEEPSKMPSQLHAAAVMTPTTIGFQDGSFSLPVSMAIDDSFEQLMWANYNKYAPFEDRVDLSPMQQSEDLSHAFMFASSINASQHDSPLSINTSILSSSAAAMYFSPATSTTSPMDSPAIHQQLHQQLPSQQHTPKSRQQVISTSHAASRRKTSKSSTSESSDQPTSAASSITRPTPLPKLSYSSASSASSGSCYASLDSPHQQSHCIKTESITSRSTITDTSASSPPKPAARKRERNRISAHKCRQRSKTKLSELEDHTDNMAEQHEKLLHEIKDLQYELIAAQVECMEHIRCRCPEVKQAMSRPAANVAGNAAAAATAAAATTTTVSPMTNTASTVASQVPSPSDAGGAEASQQHAVPWHTKCRTFQFPTRL